MILAVPYKEGQIDVHFGHCEYFMLYTVEDFKVTDETLMANHAHGHDAVVDLLYKNQVSVVLCHGMGEGARFALEAARIKMIRGASGDARAQVEAYLDGKLKDQATGCSHKKVQLGKK